MHLNMVKMALQHLSEVLWFKEIHVVRVLKVGRSVGGQKEGPAILGKHTSNFGDVVFRLNEVLNEMRGADIVER